MLNRSVFPRRFRYPNKISGKKLLMCSSRFCHVWYRSGSTVPPIYKSLSPFEIYAATSFVNQLISPIASCGTAFLIDSWLSNIVRTASSNEIVSCVAKTCNSSSKYSGSSLFKDHVARCLLGAVARRVVPNNGQSSASVAD